MTVKELYDEAKKKRMENFDLIAYDDFNEYYNRVYDIVGKNEDKNEIIIGI